jgi:hypothetical protein
MPFSESLPLKSLGKKFSKMRGAPASTEPVVPPPPVALAPPEVLLPLPLLLPLLLPLPLPLLPLRLLPLVPLLVLLALVAVLALLFVLPPVPAPLVEPFPVVPPDPLAPEVCPDVVVAPAVGSLPADVPFDEAEVESDPLEPPVATVAPPGVPQATRPPTRTNPGSDRTMSQL